MHIPRKRIPHGIQAVLVVALAGAAAVSAYPFFATAPVSPQAELLKDYSGPGESSPPHDFLAVESTASSTPTNQTLPIQPTVVPEAMPPEPRDSLHSLGAVDKPPQRSASTSASSTLGVYQYAPKLAVATIFWVGEAATADNGYIHNRSSAWDEKWQLHYGGFDDPEKRCGFISCGFTPNENAFYVALPYNDFDDGGKRKANASHVPWFSSSTPGSLLKNRWIEIKKGGATCYGQWEDVGPFETDDFAYVFGDAPAPRTTVGVKAGIDLSPALASCLDVHGVGYVTWRFVEDSFVPPGPWRTTVTTRP